MVSLHGFEIIAALINKYTEKDIIEGVKRAVRYLKYGFAFIVCTTDRLIAVRDRSALTRCHWAA